MGKVRVSESHLSKVNTLRNKVRAVSEKQTSEASEIKAAIAPGIHLYPFRTEKLSPVTPMVLRKWESR